MRLHRSLSTLASLCLLAATAFAAPPTWIEIRSRNFVIMTDAGEKRGREVARRFEEVRGSFGAMFNNLNVNSPVPLQIVAFRNNKELKEYGSRWNGKAVELDGFFLPGQDRNFIAIDTSGTGTWDVVFHEYMHLLINTNMPPMPAWFDEGAADYFSTVKVVGKNIEFGTLLPGRVYELNNSKWLKTEELINVVHDSRDYNEGDRRSVFYAQSWLTFHYIMNKGKLPNVTRYMDLTLNKRVPPRDAFTQAFGMPPEKFDSELKSYFHGQSTFFRAPAPPELMQEASTYSTRPVDAVESEATLADLLYHNGGRHEEGIAAFEKLLARFPDDEIANRGVAFAYLQKNDLDRAAKHLDRAAALGSRDPQVHFYKAMVMMRSGGFEERDAIVADLRKAIELKPDYAEAYSLLATNLMGTDKAEAERCAQKAVSLSPRNEFFVSNLAINHLQNQNFDDAELLLNQLKNSSNSSVAQSAQINLEQLARMKQYKAQPDSGGLQFRVVEENEDEDVVEVAPPPAPASSQPIRFVKGRLTSIDCHDGAATLHVKTAGKESLYNVASTPRIVVIGEDSFSCEWKNRRVAINYRQTQSGAEAISIELQ